MINLSPPALLRLIKQPETSPWRSVTEMCATLLYEALDYGGDFARSVANCHVPGLDSVVLYDGDDGMVRFYYAHAGKNPLHLLVTDDGHFAVGIHNHRYEIAKIALNGPLINVRTEVLGDWGKLAHDAGVTLWEYGFKSSLKGEGMGVEFRRVVTASHFRPDLLLPGQHVIMEPADLHTVMVSPTVDTAWMVIEGPNVEIEPLIYSPQRDLALSDDGLYEPLPEDKCRDRIRTVLAGMP